VTQEAALLEELTNLAGEQRLTNEQLKALLLLLRPMRLIPWGDRHIKRHVSQTSAAAAPEILTFDPETFLERVYHITRVVLENETSIGTGDIRIATNLRGRRQFYRQFQAPAPNVLYVEDREIILRPNEVLEARFAGTTAGDHLNMYLQGWWEPTNIGKPQPLTPEEQATEATAT